MTEAKLQALRQAGIAINSVADFCQKGSREEAAMRNYVIIGFAGASKEELREGLELFAEIIRAE